MFKNKCWVSFIKWWFINKQIIGIICFNIIYGISGNGTLIKSKIDTLAYSIADIIAKVKDKLANNDTLDLSSSGSIVKSLIQRAIDALKKVKFDNFTIKANT